MNSISVKVPGDEDGCFTFWPPDQANRKSDVVVPPTFGIASSSAKRSSWITIAGFYLHLARPAESKAREGTRLRSFVPVLGNGKEYCGDALPYESTEHCRSRRQPLLRGRRQRDLLRRLQLPERHLR